MMVRVTAGYLRQHGKQNVFVVTARSSEGPQALCVSDLQLPIAQHSQMS
jgi:hypothetical protein